MGFCKKSCKVLLATINVIILLLGAFLLLCGIMVWKSQNYSPSELSMKPVAIMLSTSIVVLFGSVLGLTGTLYEKKGCLAVYLIFVVTCLILLSMVTGLLIVAKHSIELEADQFLSDQIQLYGLPENQTVTFENSTVQTTNGINATELVDLVQQQDKCCGYNNYTDWASTEWKTLNSTLTDVPLSCCKNFTNCNGSLEMLDEIYLDGCKEPFNKTFSYFYGLFCWITLGLAVIMFSAIVITIGLLCSRRTNPFEYTAFGEPGYTTM